MPLVFRPKQMIHFSSWPDLIRPSTDRGTGGALAVDARHKAGHDGSMIGPNHLNDSEH